MHTSSWAHSQCTHMHETMRPTLRIVPYTVHTTMCGNFLWSCGQPAVITSIFTEKPQDKKLPYSTKPWYVTQVFTHRAFQGVFHRGFLKFLAKVLEERCKSRKPASVERNSVCVGNITRATIQPAASQKSVEIYDDPKTDLFTRKENSQKIIFNKRQYNFT